ncbi:hypothetical protein ID866_6630 [Astraeus odoratus]|nr:hypothetical protein ID866_6630 [Astraeus odoratus]
MDTLGTTTEGYLRAASMAVAFYELTLRSLACILFILIRYISVLVMITSNYGYFATVFTTETCRHFYFIPPMFKVLQSMVSHAILGVRTFNVAGRNKRAGTFLLVYYVITVGLEWFFDLFHRICKPGFFRIRTSCSTHPNTPTTQPVALSERVQVQYTNPTTWLFYLFAMAYDLVTLVVSTIYLLRYKTYSGKFSLLIRVMITDGLIFFVVLTIVNMLNLFLYRQSSVAAQVRSHLVVGNIKVYSHE